MKSWSDRIEESRNCMELLSLTREYLDSFDPLEIGQVPQEARPHRIKGVDDLAYWHERLVECYCGAPLRPSEVERVRDLLHFFAFATQRATELEGVPLMGEDDATTRLFSERSVPRLFTSAMTGAAEH